MIGMDRFVRWNWIVKPSSHLVLNGRIGIVVLKFTLS